MENPFKMDDLGLPLFKETPIYLVLERCLKNIVAMEKFSSAHSGKRNIAMGKGPFEDVFPKKMGSFH